MKKFTEEYEVLTSTGFQNFHGIQKVFKDSMKILFNDNTEIICSYNHKFYENEKFIYAYTLKAGDLLSGKTIISISDNGKEELYDLLEVDNGHHYTANGIESSNCAFIPKNIWHKFFTSTWPTISSGKETRAIMVSTPNGQNHFYNFWIKAKEGKNNLYPMEVNWWDVPGRDEKWKEDQLGTMTEEQFQVEYGNSFSASTNTLISADYFPRLEKNVQVPIQFTNTIRIFEEPIKDHIYFATVDCASVGNDYSTVSIIDITSFPYKQVAVFSDNTISDISFPQVIMELCIKYNNAQVLVESNEIGTAILNILNYDLEYEYIIRTYSSSKNIRLGQRTTVRTKNLGCLRLKDMIETNKILIKDIKTLEELRHFVLNSKSYSAESGYHDDLVMGLVNFAYYASTSDFRMQYDDNFTDEYRREFEHKIMEDLSPLPIFGSSLDKEDEDLRWLKS